MHFHFKFNYSEILKKNRELHVELPYQFLDVVKLIVELDNSSLFQLAS